VDNLLCFKPKSTCKPPYSAISYNKFQGISNSLKVFRIPSRFTESQEGKGVSWKEFRFPYNLLDIPNGKGMSFREKRFPERKTVFLPGIVKW
jgi:hypothetical protein